MAVKLKSKEVAKMDESTLMKTLTESRKDLFRLKAQAAVTSSQSPGRIGAVKRNIARILTRLSQIKKGGNK